jgi:hypothetical protein
MMIWILCRERPERDILYSVMYLLYFTVLYCTFTSYCTVCCNPYSSVQTVRLLLSKGSRSSLVYREWTEEYRLSRARQGLDREFAWTMYGLGMV